MKSKLDSLLRSKPPSFLFATVTLASFFLWLFSFTQAKLEIGDFGLIHSLPLTYFVSVAVLTICFLLVLFYDKGNWKVLFVQTIMLIAFLKITPVLIEGTGRPSWARFNYGFTEYIIREGNLDSSELYYHSWPGFSALSAILIDVTGFAGRESLIMLYPFLFNLGVLSVLLLFFKSTLRDAKKIWMAIWLFYFANWIAQDYFSPQSIAFILYLIILINVIKVKSNVKADIFVAILLLASLVTFHSLTPIFLILVLISLTLVKSPPNLSERAQVLALLGAILFSSWTVFGAGGFLQSSLLKYMPSINLNLFVYENILERISGSHAHMTMGYLRLAFSLLVLFSAFLGLLTSWKRGKKVDKRMMSLILGPVIVSPFLSYGGEMLFRIYLFSLIPCLYFAVQSLDSKRIAPFLIVFLMIAPFFHVATYYGTETFEYVSLSEIKGAEFFYNTTPPSLVICRDITLNFELAEKYERAYYRYHRLGWENGTLTLEDVDLTEKGSFFVWITKTDKSWFDYYAGDQELVHNISRGLDSGFNKIYSNPDFESYVKP